MPQAWLACFGRTVAVQVLDGVAERMKAPRSAELYVVEVEVQLTVCRASQGSGKTAFAALWRRDGISMVPV